MKIYWWYNKQKISTKKIIFFNVIFNFIFSFPIPLSPFSSHHFLFPIPDSSFPISYSSFPISYSSFLVLHFQFPIPRSSFPIPRSPFLILYSPFLVLHSHSQHEKSSLQLLIQPNYFTRERRDLNDTSSRRTSCKRCGKIAPMFLSPCDWLVTIYKLMIGQLHAINR